jgi:UDP-glucose 4-epimerase
MATYLVTGGCGFIGSHLCRALLGRGDAVRVLDNLSTGRISNVPTAAAFIQGDVVDPQLVREALAGVNGCFHLAAISSIAVSNHDWLGTHRTNLTGAITIFDAAMAAGPVPVVYASSAAVYGNCPSLPLDEEAEKRPLSAYGADKLGCELHACVASKVHRLPSVGLRLFNVYGPGQVVDSPYSGVISRFCERIRGGEPIEVFGDGHQTRDFIFAADVVSALLRAMDARLAGAHLFNVCTGRGTSVLEVARTIASLCGKDVPIRFRPGREGEVRHSYGNPTAARLVLGLGTPTELRTGLAATLAFLEGEHETALVGSRRGVPGAVQ